MNGEFCNPYVPYGFSSFIEMLSYHYRPLVGLEKNGRNMSAEMTDIVAKKFDEFKKSEEEADMAALSLLIEEEMEKVKKDMLQGKKERKIERKKRQRQRRKVKKEELSEDNHENDELIKRDEDDSVGGEEESFDVNSAFVSKAAIKISSNKIIPKNDTSPLANYNFKDKRRLDNSVPITTQEHPVTVLALEGFNYAKEGCLQDAIDKFSEALSLTPEDYRLYANRCLCYLQIQEFRKALRDAEDCVKYAPDYSIGYFRMGESFLGLNDFQSAEKAFEHILKLDPNCEEALNDLFFIKLKKLMDMGFSNKKATAAMHKKKTLVAAIEYLVTTTSDGSGDESFELNTTSQFKEPEGSEVFHSDEEGFSEKEDDECSDTTSVVSSVLVTDDNIKVRQDIFGFKENPYMDHKNPYHCNRLYVGNVSAKISSTFLKSTFERFGAVDCIKVLPSSKCAFLTYKKWQSAGKAMENLQNWSLMAGTPPVVIKYPTTDLQKLAGNSISVSKPRLTSNNNSRAGSACGERDDWWTSKTLPPSSPAPSLSSVRSSYSQAVLSSQRKQKNEPLKDPNNPNRCGSLFIGNLTKKVKEKDLLGLFSKYGSVVSIRYLEEKHCAFVNYSSSRSAALAMSSLQGKSIFMGLPPLVIKYPTKAVVTLDPSTSSHGGQILGDECYNWRTLGCPLGKKCPNKHIPEHKGIALRHKAVRSLNN